MSFRAVHLKARQANSQRHCSHAPVAALLLTRVEQWRCNFLRQRCNCYNNRMHAARQCRVTPRRCDLQHRRQRRQRRHNNDRVDAARQCRHPKQRDHEHWNSHRRLNNKGGEQHPPAKLPSGPVPSRDHRNRHRVPGLPPRNVSTTPGILWLLTVPSRDLPPVFRSNLVLRLSPMSCWTVAKQERELKLPQLRPRVSQPRARADVLHDVMHE